MIDYLSAAVSLTVNVNAQQVVVNTAGVPTIFGNVFGLSTFTARDHLVVREVWANLPHGMCTGWPVHSVLLRWTNGLGAFAGGVSLYCGDAGARPNVRCEYLVPAGGASFFSAEGSVIRASMVGVDAVLQAVVVTVSIVAAVEHTIALT